MRWLTSPAARERRLAVRRRRRLRQALGLYGLNEGDGMPTESELERERDAALVELLRDYRLLYGTPEWKLLKATVTDAATTERRRIREGGGEEHYARGPGAEESPPDD
jgi:hypothetical protein